MYIFCLFFFFFFYCFCKLLEYFIFCPGVIVGPACCAAALVDVAVSLVKPPDVEEKQVRIDRSKSAFDTGALG